MSLTAFLTPLLPKLLKPLLDRIPNPNERAKAEEQITEQIIAASTTAMEAQTRINEKEAGHPSVFVAGWRPFIGWTCGAALAWHYIVREFVIWGAFLAGVDLQNVPKFDITDLLTILGGMLGLSAMRTGEKWKGVARSTWGKDGG